MAARNDYQRVPVADEVEMQQRRSAEFEAASQKPAPPASDPPPSQAMVVFSVSFYLIAAIVVRV